MYQVYQAKLPLLGHGQEVVCGDGGDEGEQEDEHDHPIRHDHDLDTLLEFEGIDRTNAPVIGASEQARWAEMGKKGGPSEQVGDKMTCATKNLREHHVGTMFLPLPAKRTDAHRRCTPADRGLSCQQHRSENA